MPTPIHPGQRFGRLTVTEEAPRRSGRRYWHCRCDCGAERTVSQTHLRSGHTQSCGCISRDLGRTRARDLTGQRFGRLTALDPHPGPRGILWRCRCDCGRETHLPPDALTLGRTQSCGCRREETGRANLASSLHYMDGTCLEHIRDPHPSRVNTSGHRGVCRRKNGRWEAYITFRRKRHFLGLYATFEEAVKARLRGEEMYTAYLTQHP